MAICGFNEQIGSGIETLIGGFVQALTDRAAAENVTVGEVLRRELVEIPEINLELRRSSALQARLFVALNEFALVLFSAASAHEAQAPGEHMARSAREFVEFLRRVEGKNKDMPRANTAEAIAPRAQALASWARAHV